MTGEGDRDPAISRFGDKLGAAYPTSDIRLRSDVAEGAAFARVGRHAVAVTLPLEFGETERFDIITGAHQEGLAAFDLEASASG